MGIRDTLDVLASGCAQLFMTSKACKVVDVGGFAVQLWWRKKAEADNPKTPVLLVLRLKCKLHQLAGQGTICYHVKHQGSCQRMKWVD